MFSSLPVVCLFQSTEWWIVEPRLWSVRIPSIIHQSTMINNHLHWSREWDTGHHPFPEMSRFLNSHSRIHRPMKTKPGGQSSSFLQYLCRWVTDVSILLPYSIHFSSIADNEDKLGEVLSTFGDTYRSLIVNIIEKDCSLLDRRRELGKRTMNSIARSNFPRTLFRKMISDRPVFLPRSSKNAWDTTTQKWSKSSELPFWINQTNFSFLSDPFWSLNKLMRSFCQLVKG